MQRNDSLYYEDNKKKDESLASPYTAYNDYSDYIGAIKEKDNIGYIGGYNKTRDYKYDDEYLNRDYNSSEQKEFQNKKVYKTPKQSLIIMQLIACALIIAGVLTVKNFFPDYYAVFCDWYNSEINKSIIVGNGTQNYNEIDTPPESSQATATVKTAGIDIQFLPNSEVKTL